MDYECPLCHGRVVRVDEGRFVCQDCEARAEIPYEQRGEIHLAREKRNVPALFLPAVSIGFVVAWYYGIAPVWMALLAAIAYIFADPWLWAWRTGPASAGRGIAFRFVLVALAGVGLWVYQRWS